jgi:acyl carrier protein
MVTKTVIAAVRSAGRCPPGTVTPDSTFEELGLDSLDAINIAYELEKQLDLRLPNEEIMGLVRVSDLVERLEKFLPARLSEPESPMVVELPAGVSAQG